MDSTVGATVIDLRVAHTVPEPWRSDEQPANLQQGSAGAGREDIDDESGVKPATIQTRIHRATSKPPLHPDALSPDIRRHRRRRRPRRHRGGARRGAGRGGDAAAHAEHRDPRADELQSGHRRDRQGAPRQGDRRTRRGDGGGRRSLRNPLPHPQWQDEPGPQLHEARKGPAVGDPRPDRPRAVPAAHPRRSSNGRHRASPCSSRRSPTSSSTEMRYGGW